jgi:hypothetical protein
MIATALGFVLVGTCFYLLNKRAEEERILAELRADLYFPWSLQMWMDDTLKYITDGLQSLLGSLKPVMDGIRGAFIDFGEAYSSIDIVRPGEEDVNE